jgi:hypothetical protein
VADLGALLDPYRLEMVVRAIDAMADNMERLTKHVTGAAVEADRAFEKAERGLERTTAKTSKLAADFQKFQSMLHGLSIEGLTTTTLRGIDKMIDGWRRYREEIRKFREESARAAESGGEGPAAPKGMGSRMFQGAMNALPFGVGGLIGIMLYGQKRKEEFDAAAVRIGRILDQFGQGERAAGAVRARVEAMNYAFGSMGEELGAVMDQLAHFGMSAEMFGRVQQSAGALGHDLTGVVTALEMANRMQPGSIARMFGEVFEAGGADRQGLLNDFMHLDEIAQRTHVSVERLMSTMTQSASALRVQRQGVGDLAESYVKLYGALSQGALRGAGPQAVGAAAMRGVQAAAAGVAGLPEGLMAEISRRMGGPQGVAGIIAMQEGMGGKGKFAGGVFEQLGNIARETTGNGSREDQIFALTKIAPSLGFEGARAVIDSMLGGGSLKDIQEAIKDPQQKLLEAFGRRAKEESAWEKVSRQLALQLAHIGISMLAITMSGFTTLIKTVGALAKGDFAGAERAQLQFAGVQEHEAGNIAKALGGMATSVGGALGADIRGWAKSLEGDKKKPDIAAAQRAQLGERREIDRAAGVLEGFEGVEQLTPEQRTRMRGQIVRSRKQGQEAGESETSIALRTERGLQEFAAKEGLRLDRTQGGTRIRIVVEDNRSDLSRGEAQH